MNNKRAFMLGMMYAYGKEENWDIVDDIMEELDPQLWLATEQFFNIEDLEDFLDGTGIEFRIG